MIPRRSSRWRLGVPLGVLAGVVTAIVGCSESPGAPARCPEFCPGTQFGVVDTILGMGIGRDSSFTGYVTPVDAPVMIAADLPGTLDSRPIFRTGPILPNLLPKSGDTTTAPIRVDSIRLTLIIEFRDPAVHNLTLHFFKLPLSIDTGTTFADVAGDFAAPEIRSVNVDSLLSKTGSKDTVTGDSVITKNDTIGEIQLSLRFDTLQVPYVAADSGKVAFGVRVSGDSAAHVTLGATDAGAGPQIIWYNSVDSAGTMVSRAAQRRLAFFDAFVYDPPTAGGGGAADSTLTVGGMPTSRALLRVALPRWLRDSTQIIRATLNLVPATPATGFAADSIFISAGRLAIDVGRKSPLAFDTAAFNSPAIHPGYADTVRIEVTGMLRIWQIDTTAQMAMYLRQLLITGALNGRFSGTEGATFSSMSFYPTLAAAYKPTLHITYAPQIRFSLP